MTARMRKLLEARAAAWSAVQDIQDRRARAGYEETAEDGETYTRSLNDVERINREIEDEERAERLGRDLNTPDPTQRTVAPRLDDNGAEAPDLSEQYRSAFGSYLRRDIGGITPEQRSQLERGFVGASEEETRALGESVDAAGGFTVPQEFLQRMTEAQKAYGGILSLAELLPTASGRDLRWPTNDETGNKGHILDENTEDTELDPTFGSTTLSANMYTSRIVRVSRQLLQDSAFSLETWLPAKLGERIGRAVAEHLIIGTGVKQPQGIITGLTKGVTSAAVGKISFDDLVDLEHSVDPAYRQSPRARYVIADGALRELRKLKDTQGRPLWVPALAGGIPSTLNGIPYTVDNSLATYGLGSKSIIFGDIAAAYIVRQVAGAQTLRLNERYATSLQVGFLGFQRFDGRVQDTGAAAVLTTKAA